VDGSPKKGKTRALPERIFSQCKREKIEAIQPPTLNIKYKNTLAIDWQ
jgi:hypothetical protein